ncbi:MAG: pteridine reductase [Burkholderiales bacterium]|nr:pteridine reductase [Burkholderiales bacterium]
MEESLNGKVALVTGAARRVGAAIAHRLHGAGMRVMLHYRQSEADARALERELNAARAGSAACVRAELLAPDAPQALVDASLERFGRLDVLVNNASSFYPTRFGAIEARHWDELAGCNLRAPLFLAQSAAPHLARTNGAIVNITDIHAERPLKDYVVYTIAKAGLAALTKALALELGPAVRVNAVAPGAIAWPEDDQLPTAERKRIVATTPLGRIGAPEDIARVVEFLARASFVTGQTVAVDGGRSVFL